MDINNLILDLSRRDANRAPWHKKMTVREFFIIIFMGICAAFVDLPPIKNTRRLCFKPVRSQSAGLGRGSEYK